MINTWEIIKVNRHNNLRWNLQSSANNLAPLEFLQLKIVVYAWIAMKIAPSKCSLKSAKKKKKTLNVLSLCCMMNVASNPTKISVALS